MLGSLKHLGNTNSYKDLWRDLDKNYGGWGKTSFIWKSRTNIKLPYLEGGRQKARTSSQPTKTCKRERQHLLTARRRALKAKLKLPPPCSPQLQDPVCERQTAGWPIENMSSSIMHHARYFQWPEMPDLAFLKTSFLFPSTKEIPKKLYNVTTNPLIAALYGSIRKQRFSVCGITFSPDSTKWPHPL